MIEKVKNSTVLSASLMISGSCIGIGMLAVPVLTSFVGFFPALCIFLLAWLFMLVTAFFLAELGQFIPEDSNLLSLAEKFLGKPGKIITWISFGFLFYCLLIAYINKGGGLIQGFLTHNSRIHFPNFTGATLLCILSAGAVFRGIFWVGRFNALCMVGLVLSYAFLFMGDNREFQVTRFYEADWKFFLFTIPFIIPAFGFHNVILGLRKHLKKNSKELFASLILGSGIPLIIYVAWMMMIHGLIPNELLRSSFAQGEIATESLAKYTGNILASSMGAGLAFFAIITSLLTQSLSLVDFAFDGLKIRNIPRNRILIIFAIFSPALVLSQLSPTVFFKCLELSGGIATMILFGLVPSSMLWKAKKSGYEITSKGIYNRPTVISIFFFSSSVIFYEVLKLF